jgi:hypothetical protein
VLRSRARENLLDFSGELLEFERAAGALVLEEQASLSVEDASRPLMAVSPPIGVRSGW